jgi:hypothetical protein
MQLTGILTVKIINGPSVLYLNDEPLAKLLLDYDEQDVTLTIEGAQTKRYTGLLEAFYVETTDTYGSTKIANDLNIEDIDLIDETLAFNGQQVTITL